MKIMNKKWNAEINQMAFPILMNYLVSISFETMDKVLISQYSAEGFAAIGISGAFLYNITGALGILCSAYGILAGRAKGNKNTALYRQLFQVAMGLSVLIGTVFVVIAVITGELFLETVYGIYGTVLEDAVSYYRIAAWTVPLNLVIFQFNTFFRNEKNTRIALVSSLAAAGTNILMDYCLIYGKLGFESYGVAGAAMGSVVGLCVSGLILCIGYVRVRIKSAGQLTGGRNQKSNWSRITSDMIRLYVPLLLQDFVEYTLFSTILMALVSRLGTYEITAYHIISTITGYLILPAYAYGTVSMTLSIQLREQGDLGKANKLIQKSFLYMSTVIFMLCLTTVLCRYDIVPLFTKESEVVSCSLQYLWLPVIFQLVHGRMQLYKYVLQGWNQEKFVFYSNVFWCLIASGISFSLLSVFRLQAIFIGTAMSYTGNMLVLKQKYRKQLMM